eukprot:gene2221-490_t
MPRCPSLVALSAALAVSLGGGGVAGTGAHGAGPHYDVVVYGSTPAGIAAATAAGRLGMHVGVYEPLAMIGGMGAAGNLALNDGGVAAERTGLARAFSLLNGKHYNVSSEVPHPESFVAEASFFKMLAGAGVTDVQVGCRLTSAATAGASIASITVMCEQAPVTAAVFIDASYDGDIMVAAGNVDYTWGREAAGHYNETLAGARSPGWVGVSGPRNVNALREDGSIIKFVNNISDLPKPGEADDALMAFQHRMCISGDPDRVPWPKPDGYDPEDFLLIQRALEADPAGHGSFFTGMPPSALPGYPGHKKKCSPSPSPSPSCPMRRYCLCCGITVGASDQPNLNKGWANASWESKQQIIADHTYFELGTFFYLANDPNASTPPLHTSASSSCRRVPEATRDLFSRYGLCADEFQGNGHIPYQLYVRISNRLVGDHVITQNNIANPRNKPDSIASAPNTPVSVPTHDLASWPVALCSCGQIRYCSSPLERCLVPAGWRLRTPAGVGDWSLDEHMTGKYAVPDGKGGYQVMLEGNFWPSIAPSGGNWYDVPYTAITPKRGQGSNLLVPVCLSASAVAYSSTRIENMFMNVGTAAGVAAKQLVDGAVSAVQDVNVSQVQGILDQTFAQRYYNVSGAGLQDWDGHYVQSGSYGGVIEPLCRACLFMYPSLWYVLLGRSKVCEGAVLQGIFVPYPLPMVYYYIVPVSDHLSNAGGPQYQSTTCPTCQLYQQV